MARRRLSRRTTTSGCGSPRPAARSRTSRACCSRWRESAARADADRPRYALDRHVALKAATSPRGPLAGRREVALWGAGETGKAFADALAAEGIRVALFVEVDRKKIGRTVRGAPVVGYEESGGRAACRCSWRSARPGARELIRAELATSAGSRRSADFRCVA